MECIHITNFITDSYDNPYLISNQFQFVETGICRLNIEENIPITFNL